MELRITKYSIFLKKINEEGSEPVICHSSIISPGFWQGDKELQEVEFGSHITQINSYAFEDCTSLTTITIQESLHRIDFNAFAGCTALQKIEIPESLENVDCWFDRGRVSKITLFKPSSDELIENLKQGYAMDLYYEGEENGDHWN